MNKKTGEPMQKNEKNIHQRILGVMEDVDYIQKLDKKVNNMYRFVSHDLVVGKLHPALVKHGIVVIPNVKSLTQDGNKTTVCLDVAFVNADKPEDLIRIESWGFGIDPGDKGPGKAVSYAFKYALLKMFCLETGDDPDNDATAVHVPDTNLRQSKSDAKLSQELDLPDEEFYYRLIPFIPEFEGEKILDALSLRDFLKSLAGDKLSIKKIMSQALSNDDMTQRFCNSWWNWKNTKI